MSPCDVSLNPCCASDRFVDNGDGTVTDRLTALQWEKKTNDSTIHDSSNTYSEGTTRGAADGTVFTTFLATLNQNGSCFAQKCDWRLPTVEELQTILLKPYPCDTPCIDENLFGPVGNAWYWSSTPGYPVIGSTLMIVNFIDGTRTVFKLSSDDVVGLRNEGVSDRVVNYMLETYTKAAMAEQRRQDSYNYDFYYRSSFFYGYPRCW